MKRTVIGICDDQSIILEELEQIITEIAERWNYSWEIKTFLKGEDMLEQAEGLDIAFLDIEMPIMDGIELGGRIKEINPQCLTIMATGKVERFKEAFHIQAFRFITKPFDREEIQEALLSATDGGREEKLIELYYQRNKVEIAQEEIQYIEAFDGYAEFIIGEKMLRKDVSLDYLEEELDDRYFVRVSRKHIVNLQWVREYKKDKVLINGTEFVISRRRRKEFETKYIEYDLKYKGRKKRW